MSISTASSVAVRVWSDDQRLWLELSDGRIVGVPLGFFPRLLHGTPAQREKVEIGSRGGSLHWEDLDEDIQVAALISGARDTTRLGREHAESCRQCQVSTAPSEE